MPNEGLTNASSSSPSSSQSPSASPAVSAGAAPAATGVAAPVVAGEHHDLGQRRPPPAYIGRSAAARRVQGQIQRAVRSNQPVLLVGDPGTGKRTIAEILHYFGGRDTRQLEDAVIDEHGRLVRIGEFAYLSPLEELSLEQQLRIPELTGLGRLIIGTRLDPEGAQGRLRLHPRIVRWCTIRIDLPSLATRIEDLESLVLKQVYETPTRRPVGGISDAALDCLRAHRWPGNVSELEEVVEEALAAGNSEQIELRDLPGRLRPRTPIRDSQPSPEEQLSLEHAEREAIKRALAYHRGNKRAAARTLRIGKTTLYRKLKNYGLSA
ncbi:sigma 54-interacting transcriptional regulator [Pseudenhygromyxa sp. WMMC2535]|uniref:helix-turn-helix domain-containing protein n=1 Tax=Pseudenhygromyxa sp. WMMC2535 TaxID=2712867 RepID=UPI001554045E|nr:helix-turn-helix domain-containing protein [Pseudenhygromyxa sp. WMMC2535]NVB42674.1 sigma 54-interacting transcriptional regulator [Pseudenhygromyxa sp. WMMC2535]